jgi:hypothetical protein
VFAELQLTPGIAEPPHRKKCALAKSRGLYVSKKSADRLLKDCEKSHTLIEGENALL